MVQVDFSSLRKKKLAMHGDQDIRITGPPRKEDMLLRKCTLDSLFLHQVITEFISKFLVSM